MAVKRKKISAAESKAGRPIKQQAYSALVHDKETGKPSVVTRVCQSKDRFVNELRAEGYRVDYNRVKPKNVFDYIVNNTAATPTDWLCITAVTPDGQSNYDKNYDRLMKKNKKLLDSLSLTGGQSSS